MSTINELLEEIKLKCPGQSHDIDKLKSNIHHKTLSKKIVRTQKKQNVKPITDKPDPAKPEPSKPDPSKPEPNKPEPSKPEPNKPKQLTQKKKNQVNLK